MCRWELTAFARLVWHLRGDGCTRLWVGHFFALGLCSHGAGKRNHPSTAKLPLLLVIDGTSKKAKQTEDGGRGDENIPRK